MTQDRQRILIFAAAGFMALVAIAGFAFLVWKTVDTMKHPVTMTADERKLLVTTESLEPFGVQSTGRRGETLNAIHQLDGTQDIEYTYSSKNDSHAKNSLFVLSKVQVLPIRLTAMQVFKMEQLAIRAGVGFSGKVQLVPRPELLTFGDQRYAAVIEHEGKPAGNLFIIRQGRIVHTLTLSGFYFEKPESVAQVFEKPLAEANRQFN